MSVPFWNILPQCGTSPLTHTAHFRRAERLLAQLRRLASKQSKPYQTLIHELLERATKKVA
jgi:predicted DNA binding CopG/RHH family protein